MTAMAVSVEKSALVGTAEKYTSEIEAFTFLAEASGFGFHVATYIEGVFTSQRPGSLGN